MAMNGFAAWLETPQGRYVRAFEEEKLDLLLADIFGFNALQVGFPMLDYLRANRMPFRFACCGPHGGSVHADPHHLPFAAASIDLVLLPHVLEFDEHPHQILREVERVLVPEGSAVVVGFNPFSLWGLRRMMAGRSGEAPWQGRYLGVSQLRDWFALLGFEARAGAFGCYAPPLQRRQWLQRFSFMEKAGDRWWPIAGSVYILQAIKRCHGMRLVTPKWKSTATRKKALAAQARKQNGLNEPTTKQVCMNDE